MNINPVCEFCKWWKKGNSVTVGECRRMPPVFIDNFPEARAWPHTFRHDYCGEFGET